MFDHFPFLSRDRHQHFVDLEQGARVESDEITNMAVVCPGIDAIGAQELPDRGRSIGRVGPGSRKG